MKVIRWLAATVLVLLAGSDVAVAEPARTVRGVVLESTIALDATMLNQRIQRAAKGRDVRTDPSALAHELIGVSEETPYVLIETSRDARKDFNHATVTVVRDGFQDDSQRGDWHEFTFSRDASGKWTVLQARQAIRCWRSGVDAYAARKCP